MNKVLATNAGMWALWDYHHFESINNYQTWADLLADDDIQAQIKNRHLIPINIGG